MKKALIINYYSDVLCIWAWVAQKRIDDLKQHLGEKIEIRYHYMDIFGDCTEKMDQK